MADEKPQTTPTPAKAKATETMLVKLASAGANDAFVIGEGEDAFRVTPQGVEVAADKVEVLLEIAAHNGVTLAVGPVDKDGAK